MVRIHPCGNIHFSFLQIKNDLQRFVVFCSDDNHLVKTFNVAKIISVHDIPNEVKSEVIKYHRKTGGSTGGGGGYRNYSILDKDKKTVATIEATSSSFCFFLVNKEDPEGNDSYCSGQPECY